MPTSAITVEQHNVPMADVGIRPYGETRCKTMGRSDMGNYYHRKTLRLKDYDYSSGNICFVTVCAENRKNIFGWIVPAKLENERAGISLSETGRILEQYIRSVPGIDKYVIMPNHFHMLVWNEPGETIIQKMRSLKILVTKKCHHPVFQRSLYEHLIRNEEDYRTRWTYIDQNPDKWMLDKYYQTE